MTEQEQYNAMVREDIDTRKFYSKKMNLNHSLSVLFNCISAFALVMIAIRLWS
jgi:hypothetical protein